jgi:HEAT repeat protein
MLDNQDILYFANAETLLKKLSDALTQQDADSSRKALEQITDLYDRSDILTQYKLLTDLIELRYDNIRPLIRREVRSNPSALVRHEAAFGLGVFRNSSDKDVLIEAMLNDDHLMVRHEAAIALATTGDAECFGALEQAAREPEASVVESAEYAIRQISLRARQIKAVGV